MYISCIYLFLCTERHNNVFNLHILLSVSLAGLLMPLEQLVSSLWAEFQSKPQGTFSID